MIREARPDEAPVLAAIQRNASLAALAHIFPPELYSFMSESRRLDNRRLKRDLGVRLRYPTVYEGLKHEHALGVD